mmetsp:Transcript_27451/g.82748  ORF Transcript_27451/g.82748 Transcript_27451/m.82748 type:complete len:247 (+) Transcript_27451:615-1355(+)
MPGGRIGDRRRHELGGGLRARPERGWEAQDGVHDGHKLWRAGHEQRLRLAVEDERPPWSMPRAREHPRVHVQHATRRSRRLPWGQHDNAGLDGVERVPGRVRLAQRHEPLEKQPRVRPRARGQRLAQHARRGRHVRRVCGRPRGPQASSLHQGARQALPRRGRGPLVGRRARRAAGGRGRGGPRAVRPRGECGGVPLCELGGRPPDQRLVGVALVAGGGGGEPVRQRVRRRECGRTAGELLLAQQP